MEFKKIAGAGLAVLAIVSLSACSSGPDPKVGAAIKAAHDAFVTCHDDNLDSMNSDDSSLQTVGYLALQDCHTTYEGALQAIKVEDKFKEDLNLLIAKDTEAASAAGRIAANTENVDNFNSGFEAYKTAESAEGSLFTKLLLDYGVSVTDSTPTPAS